MSKRNKAGSPAKAVKAATAAAVKNSKKTARKPRGKAFEPGQSGNPAGRPKGAPNKATADVREAIAKLAQDLGPSLQSWIETVAEDDPGKAADIFLRAIEYHVPKLARGELTGAGGIPLAPPEIHVYFPQETKVAR